MSVSSVPPASSSQTGVHPAASRLVSAVRVMGLVVIVAGVVAAWSASIRYALLVDPFSTLNFLLPIAYLAPGVVLLLRRDWHIVGWLLCLFGLGTAFTFSNLEGQALGTWLVFFLDLSQGSSFWYPMLWLLIVFPDGLGAQTPKQRRLGRILLVVGGLAVMLEVLASEMQFGDVVVPNPLGIGFIPASVTEITIIPMFIGLLVALGALVWRHRAATPLARRQYRWVLSAIVFLVVALIIGLTGSTIGGNDGPWWFPILFAYLFLPIAFMVAILRYHLYEIDRLVSRTVTYSLVIGLLVGLYAGLVGLVGQAFPADSDVAIAVATLAAAAAFTPLRRRVQRWVDRHFNRTRFDAQIELDAFASRLREMTDLGTVGADMQAVVGRTLQPTALSLWVRGEV